MTWQLWQYIFISLAEQFKLYLIYFLGNFYQLSFYYYKSIFIKNYSENLILISLHKFVIFNHFSFQQSSNSSSPFIQSAHGHPSFSPVKLGSRGSSGVSKELSAVGNQKIILFTNLNLSLSFNWNFSTVYCKWGACF